MTERRWGMNGWNENAYRYVATIGDVDVRIHRDGSVGLQWTKTRWCAGNPTSAYEMGPFLRSRVPQHVKNAVMALIAMEKSHG